MCSGLKSARGDYDVAAIEYAASVMRYDIVDMVSKAGSGHPGGSLSATDIVATRTCPAS